jgi:hypothetical protein
MACANELYKVSLIKLLIGLSLILDDGISFIFIFDFKISKMRFSNDEKVNRLKIIVRKFP